MGSVQLLSLPKFIEAPKHNGCVFSTGSPHKKIAKDSSCPSTLPAWIRSNPLPEMPSGLHRLLLFRFPDFGVVRRRFKARSNWAVASPFPCRKPSAAPTYPEIENLAEVFTLALWLHSALRLTHEQLVLLSAENLEAVLELDAYDLVLAMTPTGSETGGFNSELACQLQRFPRSVATWKALDCFTGFRLPEASMFSLVVFLVRRVGETDACMTKLRQPGPLSSILIYSSGLSDWY